MIRTINYISTHGTKENPVPNKEISKALNITETCIRNHINKARCEGIPICACDKGYYYSEDKADILQTIQSLMNRTISVEKAVNGLITALWDKVG